ncbi:MAG: hydrogenase [Deltaproteobacteria bacterium CG_4_9_14_3_um_filter_63_12]|nr:MAG: hydrogenase [Deltaproteobacteria bacterium CG_4_9_14_3_um_filter_63_12]
MSARPVTTEDLLPFPLVPEGTTAKDIDDAVSLPMESFPTRRWWIAFSFSLGLLLIFSVNVTITVSQGIGTWGVNNPVGWGFAIVNLVFWIGIGHAGTLISAILFLFRQHWRTAIARFAEAMTLFAVLCAVQFPVLHTGRPWLAIYWMVPYPNHNNLWTNFRSPLEWDVFAISTYGTVSFLFWFLGLIPDLALARDRAKHPLRKFIYGLLSLGWNGSNRAWSHYERAYGLFAAIATPLVLSVHSVISFDFAASIVPGWHTTIFPPYFVAGAILSGFAMVTLVVVLLRKMFNLQHLVTESHLEVMNKIMLATALMVGYAYASEFFVAWYSGVLYEKYVFLNRAMGPYAWGYWSMVTCNVFVPQLLWFKKFRRNPWLMVPIVILVNVGMWFERFVIIVTSLHRDYLPAAWGMYHPTWVDAGLLVGSFGLFFTLVLLFVRFLPTIAVSELKGAVLQKHAGAHHE